MKALFLLSVVSVPLLFSGCYATVVEHPHPHRTAYVERDVVVTRPYRRPYRRETVIVEPRPYYAPDVRVRYYSDARGRYYFRNGRRIYVSY
jgi:hypothetical protein